MATAAWTGLREGPETSSNAARTVAVMFAGFCAFLSLYATQPLLPMLVTVFHASKVAAGLTVTASTIGVALGAPFIGSLADRMGRKRIIFGSTVLVAVPTLLGATSPNLHALIFWRFLQGLFTPGIFAVTVAYIHDEWTEGAGSAVAAYVTGTVIGGFCGRMASGLLAAHFGWRESFLVLGLLTLAGAVAIWVWLPEGRGFVAPPQSRSLARTMWAHLHNPQLLATNAVGFCVLFSLVGTFTYITFYLNAAPFYLNAAALGSIFFVYLIGAAVTPFAGRWVDRLGHRIMLALAIGAGVAGICLTLSHNLLLVLLGLSICCTGVFVSQSAANSYIGSAAGEGTASAVGLYVTFYYLGGSAGGAVPGFAWNLGMWPACVGLIAGVQLLTVAIALRYWKA